MTIRLVKQTPLYLQIRDILKNQILQGAIKPKESIPSLDNISQNFGVSMITARQAVRTLIDEGMLYVVAGRGTFVAKNPHKMINLGIVLGLQENLIKEEPSLETPHLVHFKEWMDFLSFSTSETNSILVNIPSSLGEDKLMNFTETNKISGIIFLAIGGLEKEILNLIKEEKMPYIVVGEVYNRKDINFVTFNNYLGAFKAAQYLVDKGHKRIAILIGTQTYYGYRERLKGYQDALTQNKILSKNISVIHSEAGVRGGYLATKELLAKKSIPTAILCSSDFKALGAIKAVREKRIKIPEEIAIVGYDDLTFSSEGDLPLTTVRVPKEEIVQEGLKILIDLILKKPVPAKRLQKEIEPNLMVRKTA